MRKIFIRENEKGHYHLEGFGRGYAGDEGQDRFSLVIESKSRHVQMEFPAVAAKEIFARVETGDPDYIGNTIRLEDFIRVRTEERELIIETTSGRLYDFFKSRGASGQCVLRAALPIAFYWSGSPDRLAS